MPLTAFCHELMMIWHSGPTERIQAKFSACCRRLILLPHCSSRFPVLVMAMLWPYSCTFGGGGFGTRLALNFAARDVAWASLASCMSSSRKSAPRYRAGIDTCALVPWASLVLGADLRLSLVLPCSLQESPVRAYPDVYLICPCTHGIVMMYGAMACFEL
jgi:hypothetical protein